MTTQESKGSKRKSSQSAEKTLSMEEKTPTMPSVFSKYVNITGKHSNCPELIYYVAPKNQQRPHCPHCACACYAHGYRRRMVRFMNAEGAVRLCKLKVRRFKCCTCGRTFSQDLCHAGISPYARRNGQLNKAMGRLMRHGVSNKDIAVEFKVSTSTVERTLHKLYDMHLREMLSYPCPRCLGIDEHSLHKGRQYAVTLTDLHKHRVYEVIDSKKTEKLEAALRKLRGRDKVKVICMDLCPQFRAIVRRLFPNAIIVADRFHVIRLVIDTLLDFSREAEPSIRWQRGLISVLRTNNANLSMAQKRVLEELLRDKPILRPAYEFKEELCALLRLKGQSRKACKEHLHKLALLMNDMKTDSTHHFKALYRTIHNWYLPIICMWRFSRNNGITEGFHRKMKLIQRRAYGFRNFANYRLRVLVECSGRTNMSHNRAFHTICA